MVRLQNIGQSYEYKYMLSSSTKGLFDNILQYIFDLKSLSLLIF